jgi:3-methyladenine DNA glycosylase/8-oxoguanine DNA glycosylase
MSRERVDTPGSSHRDGRSLEVEARPPSPFRMPAFGGADRVMRVSGGVATRLLLVEESAVLVRAWQPSAERVIVRAETVDPAAVVAPGSVPRAELRPAGPAELKLAAERMRFALGVDDDLREAIRRFRRDPLLGPLLRRRPHLRPRRRPWAWEALAWAIVRQLIESGRAAGIQRRMVGRWGMRMKSEGETLRDVPPAGLFAGRAPAELESTGLAPQRAIALRSVAREIAAGRCDPADPAADRRLLAVPEIGAWTVQCLGLFGRGDPDALPAGDLTYLKLVGRLARLGRRATVEEVEEFYAPYEPFRGLAAAWSLSKAGAALG